MSEELEGYKITVYSANKSLMKLAREVTNQTGLEITAFGKGAMSHKQALKVFAKSRIYVDRSQTDGINTSMLDPRQWVLYRFKPQVLVVMNGLVTAESPCTRSLSQQSRMPSDNSSS
jgi:stage V sporulation protein SpoVS